MSLQRYKTFAENTKDIRGFLCFASLSDVKERRRESREY